MSCFEERDRDPNAVLTLRPYAGMATPTTVPTLVPPGTDSPGRTIFVHVNNDTDWEICYVYISPTQNDTWGSNWLDTQEKIAIGDARVFQVDEAEYDLRVENCDHMRLGEQYNQRHNSSWNWYVENPLLLNREVFTGGLDAWVQPDKAAGKAEVLNPGLKLSATGPSPAVLRLADFLSDAILVVEVTPGQGTGLSAYGAGCRLQDNGDGYLFLVRSDHQVSIQKVVGGKWTPLADWTTDSEAAFDLAPNALQITCNGSDLALRVNGATIAKATDEVYTGGQFGLAVVSLAGGAADYRFDNLVMINP